MENKKPPAPKQKKLSKSTNRGLGRGLSALMADVSLEASSPPQKKPLKKPLKKPAKKPAKKTPSKMGGAKMAAAKTDNDPRGVQFVAIDRLSRNPDQPRRIFDKTLLKELTDSIRLKGVLQPILVRPIPKGATSAKSRETFQIVAGERRYQAALAAGLDAMPVLVRELSDQEVLEIGVVENVQRANLNPIEEAQAYQALKDNFGRTQEDIAKAVGKSRPHIANTLRLLSLPTQARRYLELGRISTGHARAIIAAPDPDELADMIAEHKMSVREAEDWVRRIKAGGTQMAKPRAYKSPDIISAEQQLADYLGLTVDLRHKAPGGELRIKYKTGDQLEELMRRLKD